MTLPTNADRADWALLGLQTFVDRLFRSEADRDMGDFDAFDQAVGDLLGNLHHLANQQLSGPRADEWRAAMDGEDVPAMLERLLERGRCYYEDELTEEAMP